VPSAERRSKFRPQSTPRRWPRLAAAVLLAAAAVLAWWFGRPTTIGPAASSEAAAPLPPTRDVDAYRFYLQAESVVNGTAESFVAAIALYDEALRRDPDFARALAGRAMNRAALVWTGSTLARGLEDAQRDAARALELEPGNVDTQLVLASIGALLGDWTAAEAGFRAAIAANPVSAGAHGRYAVGLLLPTGQLRKAAAEAEEALRLAPSDGFSASMLSLVEQASGADSDAVRSADLALSRGADARAMETVYASAAARSGHYAEAAEHAIKSFPPAIRDAGGVPTMQLAFSALADAEKRSAALDALRKLRHETAWERLDPRSKQPVFYVYGALGAVDDLYDEMSQSLRRDGGEYPEIITIATLWSPELRTFRRDPRFQALAERLGLIAYWSEFGSPDDCSVTAGKLNCN
jgi:tetratricopeptide (TPR) repeat protein